MQVFQHRCLSGFVNSRRRVFLLAPSREWIRCLGFGVLLAGAGRREQIYSSVDVLVAKFAIQCETLSPEW